MVRAVQVGHGKFERCVLGGFTGNVLCHVEHFAFFLVVNEKLPIPSVRAFFQRRAVIPPTRSRSGATSWTGPYDRRYHALYATAGSPNVRCSCACLPVCPASHCQSCTEVYYGYKFLVI